MEKINLQSSSKLVIAKTSSVSHEVSTVEVKGNTGSGKVLPLDGQEKETAQSTKDVIRAKVSELNSHVQKIQRSVEFSIHEETGRSVIKVKDKETGEEIRRFPSEQILDMAAHIAESLALPGERGVGLLINGKA